jgi:hypothetical protein
LHVHRKRRVAGIPQARVSDVRSFRIGVGERTVRGRSDFLWEPLLEFEGGRRKANFGRPKFSDRSGGVHARLPAGGSNVLAGCVDGCHSAAQGDGVVDLHGAGLVAQSSARARLQCWADFGRPKFSDESGGDQPIRFSPRWRLAFFNGGRVQGPSCASTSRLGGGLYRVSFGSSSAGRVRLLARPEVLPEPRRGM